MHVSVTVKPIKPHDAYPWLLEKHYARRLCPISYSFGVFYNDVLRGVVTYGVPVSSSLRAGICGSEHSARVLELNRLCCDNEKNIAFMLVGRSLKMLPAKSIVVSYADTAQGHIGYVYQACNFIYTGLSAKRTDWKIKGMERLHGSTVADMSRGQENRAKYMRDRFGDSFYLQDRPRKHRYIYFTGSRSDKRILNESLLYCKEPYPKGASQQYDAGNAVQTQGTLF